MLSEVGGKAFLSRCRTLAETFVVRYASEHRTASLFAIDSMLEMPFATCTRATRLFRLKSWEEAVTWLIIGQDKEMRCTPL